MFDKEKSMLLLAAFVAIKYDLESGMPYMYIEIDQGICRALGMYINCTELRPMATSDFDIIDRLTYTWEHFSGNKYYPVPSVNQDNAVKEYKITDNFWDMSNEYNQLRLDLLNHCIDCLTYQLGM